MLDKLFGGGAVDAVKVIGGAVDELFTSDEERAQGEAIMEGIRQKPELAEKMIQLARAKSTNWFVAAARPALIWVSALCVFMFFVPQYAVAAYVWGRHCLVTGEIVAYPVDASGLLQVVGLALGMSGFRMLEKKWKVAR